MQTPSNNGARSFIAWIWASVLVLGGAGILVYNMDLLPGGSSGEGVITLLTAGATALLSIPFMIRWLTHHSDWWALITAWVFFSIAVLMGSIYLWPDRGVVIFIIALGQIAAPFALVYFVDRKHWWALILSYAMLMLGVLAAMTTFGLSAEILGAIALLAIAVPFWVVYISDRAQWWALIPAGIIGAIGALMLIFFSITQSISGGFYIILNAVLAGVCLSLWLTMKRLDWALWLMSGFIVAAVMSVWYPSPAAWGIQALIIGIYIAYQQIKSTSSAASSPTVKTAAQPQPTPPPAVSTPSAQPSPTTTPPPPTISPQAKDAAATERAQAAGTVDERKPLVDFRPLDPFEDRQEDEEKQK